MVVLALAVTMLGERAGKREVTGAGAIAIGVAALTLAAPERHAGTSVRDTTVVVVAFCVFGVLPRRDAPRRGRRSAPARRCGGTRVRRQRPREQVASPTALARCPGRRRPGVALAALTGAIGAAAEMSAFQRLAAGTVAPITFALEIAVPVALAPWLTRDGAHSRLTAVATVAALAVVVAGVTVLARGPAVADTVSSVGRGRR